MTILCYHIQKDCRLKEGLTFLDMIPFIMIPSVQEQVRSRQRRGHGEARDEGHQTYRFQVEVGARVEYVEVGAEELGAKVRRIMRFIRRCRDCPANLSPSAGGVGCFGHVDLPITRRQEELLLAVVERLMESSGQFDPTVTLPVRYIWDNGLEGEEIALLRERSDILASKERIEARIGPFLQKKPLNTDQLLSLIMLPGKIRRPYLHLFAPFFAQFVRMARELPVEDVWQIESLILYCEAMGMASDLDVPVEAVYLDEAPEAEDRGELIPQLTSGEPGEQGKASAPSLEALEKVTGEFTRR